MPNIRDIGAPSAGNKLWLDSTHGIYNQRSVKLDRSAFSAISSFFSNSIPSGQPLAFNANNEAIPYDAAGIAPANVLVGFLFEDQSMTSNTDEILNVSMVDHGRVQVGAVPDVNGFTPPTAANDATTVVYSN